MMMMMNMKKKEKERKTSSEKTDDDESGEGGRDKEREREKEIKTKSQSKRCKHGYGPQRLMLFRESLSRSQSVVCVKVQADAFKALANSVFVKNLIDGQTL